MQGLLSADSSLFLMRGGGGKGRCLCVESGSSIAGGKTRKYEIHCCDFPHIVFSYLRVLPPDWEMQQNIAAKIAGTGRGMDVILEKC